MSPEKQRVAIGIACGWKSPTLPEVAALQEGWSTSGQHWLSPAGVLRPAHHMPDYLNDLNAMHEAEKVLNQMQSRANAYHLAESEQNETWASCHIWHQSAAQRAEAFLRVMELWEDAQ